MAYAACMEQEESYLRETRGELAEQRDLVRDIDRKAWLSMTPVLPTFAFLVNVTDPSELATMPLVLCAGAVLAAGGALFCAARAAKVRGFREVDLDAMEKELNDGNLTTRWLAFEYKKMCDKNMPTVKKKLWWLKLSQKAALTAIAALGVALGAVWLNDLLTAAPLPATTAISSLV